MLSLVLVLLGALIAALGAWPDASNHPRTRGEVLRKYYR
jgi:hypothetical protein